MLILIHIVSYYKLFLYFNLYLSVKLNSLSCSFTPTNATAISAIGGKTLITRYQASRDPHDVTSAQLLIVVWKMLTFSEERFVGVSEAEPSTDIDHSYP